MEQSSAGRRLVLVTGVGRSGTSLMAGVLHHLGLAVPGPFLDANESNPRGFFESRWSVRFHNRLLADAGVYLFDARPEAAGLVQAAVTPQRRQRLRSHVDELLAGAPVVVVKDPRTVWTQQLWADAAAAAGADTSYVMMLRPPAEVAASRATYYSGSTEERAVRAHQVASVARWVHHTLLCERRTRGASRAVVRYSDLLDDWRATTSRLGDHLGLPLDVTGPGAGAVDDFVEPGLRRHDVATAAALDLPWGLGDLADEVWAATEQLADSPTSTAVGAELDALARRYDEVSADVAAMATDWVAAARRRAAAPEDSRSAAVTPGPPAVEDRPVRDATARELLAVVGRRAAGRLRRP